MRLVTLIATGALLLALPGIASAKVWATDAVVHPGAAGGPPTAAYLTLHNDGGKPVKLTGVDCGCAEMVMAHRSSEQNGIAHMAPTDAVVIPPHGKVSFAPGGLHLMLMSLKRSIKTGESVPMTLRFDAAKPLTVRFPAKR